MSIRPHSCCSQVPDELPVSKEVAQVALAASTGHEGCLRKHLKTYRTLQLGNLLPLEPLLFALKAGHLPCARLLIPLTDQTQEHKGLNALQLAALLGSLESVQLLVECGANLNQEGKNACSEMSNSWSELPERLNDYKELIDRRTPLDLAVQNRAVEMVYLLVALGAEVTIGELIIGLMMEGNRTRGMLRALLQHPRRELVAHLQEATQLYDLFNIPPIQALFLEGESSSSDQEEWVGPLDASQQEVLEVCKETVERSKRVPSLVTICLQFARKYIFNQGASSSSVAT